MASSFHPSMQQHPGVHPGHAMAAPGMAHNPSQPGAQQGIPPQLAAHMAASGPGGQVNPAAMMGGMPQAVAGPTAHALSHLSPQIFQQQQPYSEYRPPTANRDPLSMSLTACSSASSPNFESLCAPTATTATDVAAAPEAEHDATTNDGSRNARHGQHERTAAAPDEAERYAATDGRAYAAGSSSTRGSASQPPATSK